ncbi:MAG: hypothetical protein HY562_05160 [Ignavibacteriales bacterium]|nr:hypothetical protein [Ignavibacteriales bacterium]
MFHVKEGVTVTMEGGGKSVKLVQNNSSKAEEFFFERTDAGTLLKNSKGETLVHCLSTDEGGIVLKEGAGKVISMYSSGDLEKIARNLAVE